MLRPLLCLSCGSPSPAQPNSPSPIIFLHEILRVSFPEKPPCDVAIQIKNKSQNIYSHHVFKKKKIFWGQPHSQHLLRPQMKTPRTVHIHSKNFFLTFPQKMNMYEYKLCCLLYKIIFKTNGFFQGWKNCNLFCANNIFIRQIEELQ